MHSTPTPRSNGWSIARYMTFGLITLMVVAASSALFVRFAAEDDARQEAQIDSDFASRVAAQYLNDNFAAIQTTAANVAANLSTGRMIAAPSPFCSLTFDPEIASTGHLDVIAPDGTVVCSSGDFGASAIYAGAPWLSKAQVAPTKTAPYLDPSSGAWVAAVTAPVPGGGAVAAFVSLVSLGLSLTQQFGGPRHLEFLVTSTAANMVVVRTSNPGKWVGSDLAGTVFDGSPAAGERAGLDGTSRLYGRATVPAMGWSVYAGANKDAALAAADLLANRGLAIVVAGLVVMLGIGLVIQRRIAWPLRQLSRRMRAATGGSDIALALPNGAAEITGLAHDLDDLMTAVKLELSRRLESEQAVRLSERNYRTLFVGHPQPMWVYDEKTLEFLDVNHAAVEMYGYTREEFLKMTIKGIRPQEDVPKFLELIADQPAYDRSGPWRHVHKNGTMTQVLVTSHTLRFGDRDARFVMAEELTDVQRLELELHKSQARVEASSELARIKDELVSMVSHELRTPLASVVGFAELLSTRAVSDDQRKEYLTVMLQEGRRLTALINDFLDLQRIESGREVMDIAPADIGALIERSVASAGADELRPIEIRLADHLPLVMVDANATQRVLFNLISNARKYSPSGGDIIVGAGVTAGMVQVYVKDHGLGIPREELPRLSEKFYRVDTTDRRQIKGTGLGLAISKRIVEAHGGSVTIRSEGPGRGSLFMFTVPMALERSKLGDVLVVEDDAGFAHLLEAELAAKGLSIVWAADAETAEKLSSDRMARAVVLDLLLPGLQGGDFLMRLRASHGADIPVVVVTVKSLEPAESMALQRAGVTAILRKGAGTAQAAAALIAQSIVREAVAS